MVVTWWIVAFLRSDIHMYSFFVGTLCTLMNGMIIDIDVTNDVCIESHSYKHDIFYIYIKILEVNLFAFANANKLTSRIFVYKSSPLSTLPLVIPEYI